MAKGFFAMKASVSLDSAPLPFPRENLRALMPGVLLCGIVASVAYALEAGERMLAGRAWLEALVLAIVLGTGLRSLWSPSRRFDCGISFSSKYLLEIAVVLLGASISGATLVAAGPGLLLGIAGVVASALLLGFAIGRALGLPMRMALLVACGNAICGNSAIAAVAPVIGADGDDVAASIAFTAVLGVVVVLSLPLAGLALGLSGHAFGAFAGLTVYAVPQVIAAAAPLGALAVQTGTLVKLVRVLMLGPVCLVLSLLVPRPAEDAAQSERRRPTAAHLVPWFIVGFLVMMLCRTLGLIPQAALDPMSRMATVLTVVSMAALGLGVDVRTVAQAGGRVTVAVVLSLAGLGTLSLGLLHVLHMV